MISEMAEVKKSSLEINHNTTRVVKDIPIGKGIRQGDVYLKRVEKIPPEYSVHTMDLKIAKGDTKGSRHILEDTKGLRVYRKSSPGPLEGPAFTSVTDIHLTHPEHPSFCLAAGTYLSYYQRDMSLEEIRAVRD
jgi:hypothetical protein